MNYSFEAKSNDHPHFKATVVNNNNPCDDNDIAWCQDPKWAARIERAMNAYRKQLKELAYKFVQDTDAGGTQMQEVWKELTKNLCQEDRETVWGDVLLWMENRQ
jgi:hypothetical protein